MCTLMNRIQIVVSFSFPITICTSFAVSYCLPGLYRDFDNDEESGAVIGDDDNDDGESESVIGKGDDNEDDDGESDSVIDDDFLGIDSMISTDCGIAFDNLSQTEKYSSGL